MIGCWRPLWRWGLPPEIAKEEIRHIVAEALPDDDPQRRQVGPVLRERVRGDLPAALPQGVGDVEDGEVVDPVREREREHRELVPLRKQLEGAEGGDLRR